MNATPNPIDLQKHLGGVDYPASRDDLVRTAEQHGAGSDLLDALRGIPDKQYDSPTAVSKAVSS